MKRLFLILLMCAPAAIFAQDQAPTTLLPDIDPQDIEIRGDFVARFPGIMRQPILGFNPRPRVFQIDPNRMPFTESSDQVVASLPITDLERPAAPDYEIYTSPERFNFWSTTGIGNYLAPEADVYLGLKLSDRTTLSGRLNHHSADNYLEDPFETGAFRNFDTGLNLIHYSGKKSRWDLGITQRSDRNYSPLYRVVNPNLPVALTPAFYPHVADNNIKAFGSSLGYRYTKNALSFWDVALNYSGFGADIERLDAQDSTTVRYNADETRFGATIRKDWTANRPGNTFSASASFQYADYSAYEPVPDTEISGSWYVGNAGLVFRTQPLYNLNAEIGGRLYYTSDEVNGERILFYPELAAKYMMSNRLTLRANILGFAHNQGFEDHSRVNRKLMEYNAPETENGIQLKVSSEYTIFDGFRAQSGLSYTRYGRMSAFGLQPNNPFEARLMNYGYNEDVDLIKWDASVWFNLIPQAFHLYGGFYVQYHNDGNGDPVAFMENVGVSAGGTYKFGPRTRVHGWADYTGPRRTGVNDQKSDGYLLIGSKFDVWLSRDIGAYLKITNLLNQSYSQWIGYNELPTQIYGGIMLKF